MSYVYLQHHGIKGQKWGVRRYQNADGTYTLAGKRRRYINTYSESIRDAKNAKKENNNRAYANFQNRLDKLAKSGRGDDIEAVSKVANQYDAERKSAKSTYKSTKESIKRTAVAEYNKKYNAAERASNLADKKWDDVNEQYKALGKTRITRLINAAKNESDAAKKYNSDYDAAVILSGKADYKWREATAAYRNTGRSKVERVLNNIKYDPNRKKNK